MMVGLAALLATAPVARAQPNPPHIGYVYPAGGRRGTTFQAKIGGQYLNGAAGVYGSGDGIQARQASHAKGNQRAARKTAGIAETAEKR
jgi:hypothetical protein